MEGNTENILLVTVTKIETQAVIDVFEQATASRRETERVGDLSYHHLGQIGRSAVILTQLRPRSSKSGGPLITISEAIKQYSPTAFIMTGLALGLNHSQQKMGDILVSEEVVKIDNATRNKRPERYRASRSLLNIARAINLEWSDSTVHFGSVLTIDELSRSNQFVSRLLKQEPEAIGGEMEGAVLGLASTESKVDWILIKSISDFSDEGKDDNFQQKAANNSARFVLLMIQYMNKLSYGSSSSSSGHVPNQESDTKGDDVEVQLSPASIRMESKLDSVLISATGTVRWFEIQESALEKHATSDQPIHDIKQDKLGFTTYVTALYDFIVSQYTSTPLTISVDGPWGTGKSSLMYMLKNSLDPSRTTWQIFIHWLAVTREWWRWFLNALWVIPLGLAGNIFLKITLKANNEPWSFTIRKRTNHPIIANLAADIAVGLSSNPETLDISGNELSERAYWWARIHAKCQPMEPEIHPTVWLNAWKFDNQEEVWAALAISTLEQIKKKHNIFWIIWFRIRLAFKRFSFLKALFFVLLQYVLPIVLGFIALLYDVIIRSYKNPLDAFINPGISHLLIWLLAIVAATPTIVSLIKDPFQTPVDKVVDSPNYKDKIGFLTHFEKDFARIVELITNNGFGRKNSKLIIFIDDLDRCEPPKSADIIEAVNLFFDAKGCIFVIGMDSESVARSIEVKYKDLFDRMRVESAGVISLGRAFLDKIVQIPFTVPRATPSQIQNMVKDTLSGYLTQKIEVALDTSQTDESISTDNLDQGKSRTEKRQINPIQEGIGTEGEIDNKLDPASLARTEVRKAIYLGTNLLSENPRQVKTFINLFRLSIYIANARGFFEEQQDEKSSKLIGLDRLAYWIVLSVRWPNLVKHLHIETQANSLRNFLNSSVSSIRDNDMWDGGLLIPDGIKTDLANIRDTEKGSEAHWCHLPWEWWFLEKDLLKCLKSSKDLWLPHDNGMTDWLEVFLTMTRTINPN
jgi:nucleoside phosphorylase